MTATEPADDAAARWDAFVEWARRFYEHPRFDDHERNYKLEIAEAVAEAREAFLRDSPDWRDKLLAAVNHPANNLTARGNWRYGLDFRNWLDSDEQAVREALHCVWDADDAALQDRAAGFTERTRAAGFTPGTGVTLMSFFLMGRDATQYPFWQDTPFRTAYKLTGRRQHERGSEYQHAIGFLDAFVARAAERGLEIADRVDAQSLVWCVTKEGYDPDGPQDVLDALAAYRAAGGDPNAAREAGPATDPRGPDWAALAAELMWAPHDLEAIVADLEHKGQLIFYGPPGTGKTYVARKIAAAYAAAGGEHEIVQFHPSYAYEDFVEGYRPAETRDGQPAFALRHGPLRRIAERAAANPDAKCVLVIDELNRGNVAKVFGELYFLLEYRDEEITLQYGGEPFRLPANLLFVCTMNTADRSIALLDAALRRRFWFRRFFPGEPPIEGLLRRWLDRNAPDMAHVADLVDLANELLDDADAAIGPSYFMGDPGSLEANLVERIWKQAVMPYVEERCFGDDAKLESLRYDSLKRELDRRSGEANGGAGGEASGAGADPDGDAGDA